MGRYGGSERMVTDGCTLTSCKKTTLANRLNDRFKPAFFLSATTPSTFCKPGQFRCGSSTTCIDDSKVCDKHPDCTHGEDETKCGKYKRTWQLAVNFPSPLPVPGPWAVGGRGCDCWRGHARILFSSGEHSYLSESLTLDRISLRAFPSQSNTHCLNACWQANHFNFLLGKDSYFSLDKIQCH